MVLVILGPTCSWKSAAAFRVAQLRNGEIISCDSMQVYHDLNIGTAQPSPEERLAVPHHLVDFMDFEERWDASRFVPAAQKCIAEIQSRGALPIVAGGTGLYAKALCYPMELLPSDRAVAAEMRERIETPEGVLALQQELSAAVGELPEDIRLNPRHLARAAEVWRLSGKAPWQLREKGPQSPYPEYRQFIILPETEMLKVRIHRRTRLMLEAGWVDEARRAVRNGLLEAPTAWQALGYRDIADFDRAGSPGGDDALAELLGNRTMRYARRQLTWFKHQHPGATFITVDQEEGALDKIVAEILCHLS